MDTYFTKLQFKKAFRYFKTNFLAKGFTVFLFLVVLGGLSLGIYRFFLKGFVFIDTLPFFASAISLYMYELFLLVVFLMVWITSVISVLFSLFRDKGNFWILATPNYKLVPNLSFISTVFSTSWVLLVVLLPATLAAVNIAKVNPFLSIIPIVFSLIFSCLVTASVFIFTLLLGNLLTLIHRKLLSFTSVLIVHGAIILGMVYSVMHRFRASDLIKVLYAEDLNINKAPLTLVEELYKVFPTHTLAKVYLYAQTGEMTKLVMPALVILVAVVITLVILKYLLKLWFLPIWQALSENQTEFLTPGKKRIGSLAMFQTPFRTIIYKELMGFTRNARSMFWFVFIFVLWLAHIGSQVYLQRIIIRYELQDTQLPILVNVLPVAVLSYFTAALVLRFAFPSFSEEKETAWILMSSPISQKKIIWAKYLFYTLIFVVLTLLAHATSLSVAVTSQPYAVSVLILSIAMTIFLTAIGVALGAIFPNFETTDPERLSTSIPGLLTVFISIAYGALAAYIFYSYIKFNHTFALYAFEVASVVLPLIFIHLSGIKAKTTEFVSKRVS